MIRIPLHPGGVSALRAGTFALGLGLLPSLALAEIGESIAARIAQNWNLGAASREVLQTRIVVGVEFDPNGTPGSIRLIESEGPSENASEQAFGFARRAILRAFASGEPLPPESYDSWKSIELVFDGKGMVLR